MPYLTITASDIASRVSDNTYLRLFDKNGTGIVDLAFVTLCINEAVSRVAMKLGAAFPSDLGANGAVVDESIKGAAVAICLRIAEQYNPLSNGTQLSPFKDLHDSAVSFLDDLRKDNGQRPRTAAGGRALPQAENTSSSQSQRGLKAAFERAASIDDRTGY